MKQSSPMAANIGLIARFRKKVDSDRSCQFSHFRRRFSEAQPLPFSRTSPSLTLLTLRVKGGVHRTGTPRQTFTHSLSWGSPGDGPLLPCPEGRPTGRGSQGSSFSSPCTALNDTCQRQSSAGNTENCLLEERRSRARPRWRANSYIQPQNREKEMSAVSTPSSLRCFVTEARADDAAGLNAAGPADSGRASPLLTAA